MADILKGKKIVLGITGSIAAYKACYLIRGLIKRGAEVQVVITPAGKEFITPITLSALTSKPVISDFFAQRDGTWHSHVDLGLWADAMLVAPATASTIGNGTLSRQVFPAKRTASANGFQFTTENGISREFHKNYIRDIYYTAVYSTELPTQILY